MFKFLCNCATIVCIGTFALTSVAHANGPARIDYVDVEERVLGDPDKHVWWIGGVFTADAVVTIDGVRQHLCEFHAYDAVEDEAAHFKCDTEGQEIGLHCTNQTVRVFVYPSVAQYEARALNRLAGAQQFDEMDVTVGLDCAN